MRVLGLTGSIGMGKSYVVNALKSRGVPIFDSDREVQRLLRDAQFIARIASNFPGVVDQQGQIDRAALGNRIFKNPEQKIRLERLIHPRVLEAQGRFLKALSRAGCQVAVIDIPLLFETRAQWRFDATIVVDANRIVQEDRVLSRAGMTRRKMEAIITQQMSSFRKGGRATFVIPSGSDRGRVSDELAIIFRHVRVLPRRAWPAYWHRQKTKES